MRPCNFFYSLYHISMTLQLICMGWLQHNQNGKLAAAQYVEIQMQLLLEMIFLKFVHIDIVCLGSMNKRRWVNWKIMLDPDEHIRKQSFSFSFFHHHHHHLFLLLLLLLLLILALFSKFLRLVIIIFHFSLLINCILDFWNLLKKELLPFPPPGITFQAISNIQRNFYLSLSICSPSFNNFT